MKVQKFGRGQTLIEILVATGIIVLVLVGVADLITRSLGLSSYQAGKNKAEDIAKNQLNYYRHQRDLNPTIFFVDPQTNFSSCVGTFDEVKYQCTIIYDTVGLSDGVNMEVNIAWKDGDKSINTKLSQVLARPTK